MWIITNWRTIITTILVYVRHRNQNPNWPILLADTVTDTETPFQRENLVDKISSSYLLPWWPILGIFSILKGPHKPNFFLWEKMRKIWKKKLGWRKKRNLAPMPTPKLDIGFGSRYRNLVSVEHYHKLVSLLSNHLHYNVHLCRTWIEE